MRFDPITCPEHACGETARGTLERLSGVALLDVHQDGTADYAGDTEIFWDEQRSVRDEQGKVTLICPNGHDWNATVDALPDPSEQG